MNKLTGFIVSVESTQAMSLVAVDVDGDIFSAIVLETPPSAPYLAQGSRVILVFKETEVALARGLSGEISLRNRFKAAVKRMESSPLLSKIMLDYKGREIVSVISTGSAQRLMLAAGDEVEWLVKTNEVSLLNEGSDGP